MGVVTALCASPCLSFGILLTGISPRYAIVPLKTGSIRSKSSGRPAWAIRSNICVRIKDLTPSHPTRTSHVAVVPSPNCKPMGSSGVGSVYEAKRFPKCATPGGRRFTKTSRNSARWKRMHPSDRYGSWSIGSVTNHPRSNTYMACRQDGI
jgi:hypothetical protein